MISLKEVENIQKEWGDSLVKLGSLKNNRDACEKEVEMIRSAQHSKELNLILLVEIMLFLKIADLLYNHGRTLGLKTLQLF